MLKLIVFYWHMISNNYKMSIEQLLFHKWLTHDLIQKCACNWHCVKWVEKRDALNYYIDIQ